jgi:biopolymer transport protein ExbB
MHINDLAQRLGDACYGFLALNFLWGLYCVILVWRRLALLRFRNSQAESAFIEELRGQLGSKQYDTATQMCEYNPLALARVATVMLANRSRGYAALRQIVSQMVQRDILADLEYRLSWIATVIKNGPLLGLFGTVLGMMAAFGRIGMGEKVQASQIADEISIALICTAMGLATAIPFGYILASLTIRLRLLQESLGSGLAQILEKFKSEAA